MEVVILLYLINEDASWLVEISNPEPDPKPNPDPTPNPNPDPYP